MGRPAGSLAGQTGPDGQPGINGGLFKRQGPVGRVDTIDVPSIDQAGRSAE